MSEETPEWLPLPSSQARTPGAAPSRARDSEGWFQDRLFRERLLLHVLIYGAGFLVSFSLSRWVTARRVWLALPAYLAAHFTISLSAAVTTITGLAIVLAFTGALLRTWGNAYLGAGVVFDSEMRGARMVVEGPYRFLRNPLYVGTVLHTLALCLLMTWPGALLTLVLILALQAALIGAEERYLARNLGETYAEYVRAVPRLLPKLSRSGVARTETRGAWGYAAASEIYMWGTAVSFAVFGWTYNPVLILQGVLVSFGLAIVVRGLLGQR